MGWLAYGGGASEPTSPASLLTGAFALTTPSARISAVRLKNGLGDIQTNRANFAHGRLLLIGAQQHLLWHKMPSGGVHPIRQNLNRRI